MTRARRKPLDPDLYAAVVEEAKTRFAVWPSADASGWVVKTYKARGGRYAGQGRKESTGLTKWFGEEWVDLSRPTADGGYEPCGRKKSNDPADYPKCRPLKEALRMSPDEVADAVRRKRRAEASAPGRGMRARPPKRVATYRENPGNAREPCRRRRRRWRTSALPCRKNPSTERSMIKAKKPKPPIHIHVFEEMYAPDGDNWWSVRSEYVGSGKGKTFEIGGVFDSKQRAIQFALDQAEHYRNMMDDHTFEVLLSDENGDEQSLDYRPATIQRAPSRRNPWY